MTPRETYEDFCIAAGQAVPTAQICTNCERSYPPFGLVKHEEHNDWICGHCVIDTERIKDLNPVLNVEEFWNHIKSQRNKLLNDYSWTIREDSPLSFECKAKYLLFLRSLHRITIDNSDPTKVCFPEPPIFEYGILSKG